MTTHECKTASSGESGGRPTGGAPAEQVMLMVMQDAFFVNRDAARLAAQADRLATRHEALAARHRRIEVALLALVDRSRHE